MRVLVRTPTNSRAALWLLSVQVLSWLLFSPGPALVQAWMSSTLTKNKNKNKFNTSKKKIHHPSYPQQQRQQQERTVSQIRIRTTQESDIPQIANILSTAAISSSSSSSSSSSNSNKNKNDFWTTPNNWKATMDQLWAKADIEALLLCRYHAIQEGRKAFLRVSQDYPEYHMMLDQQKDRQGRDKQQLQLLELVWKSHYADRFRTKVEKAAFETGEDNVWKRHNFCLAPNDPSWLHHVQMTAQDVTSQQIVGFCEVAMLSSNKCQQQESCHSSFSPAIANLATASSYRRQGIATRLLTTAQRLVRQQWRADTLGLYVEKDNAAAVACYKNAGFVEQGTCDGGDQLGEMWYMAQRLVDDKALSAGYGYASITDRGESM